MSTQRYEDGHERQGIEAEGVWTKILITAPGTN